MVADPVPAITNQEYYIHLITYLWVSMIFMLEASRDKQYIEYFLNVLVINKLR